MQNIVKVENLSYFYKNIQALDNINIDLKKGQTIALVGPDGVGKSTLLSILAGAKTPKSGSVEVFGYDITKKNQKSKIYSKIAYMAQGLGKNLYFSLSVYENVDFFAKLFNKDKKDRAKTIETLLKAIGLYQFKDRLAGKLSGGMKQKLGLCCALVHSPKLLILDEPTTGIDPLSRRDFWNLINSIQKQNPDMTIIVSTAYMQEALLFDTIIAINNGKILANLAPKELLEQTNTNNIDEAFIKLMQVESNKNLEFLNSTQKYSFNDKQTVIKASNLTMKFGDFIAVNNVSFEIKEGEIFGFLGSNGCGKTTTMKMLTGLLKASSGEIELFGKPIQSNDLHLRKNVGYMTQSFSLYNDLSVKENLLLHAKLYQIESSKIKDAIKESLEYFMLQEYEEYLVADLPLGIKQRLSLATAVIHKPKMLILDEPTSGVDPISRDIFWEFLLQLSRKDGVTIFISTHFMNEGSRCDRISLMHQGKVLASDTPLKLMQNKRKNDLEEAFIEYLTQEDENISISNNNSNYLKPSIKNNEKRFSFIRAFGYANKEYLELIKDPIRVVFAFFGTIILMLVMGYGISMDVENLKFAVLDHDKTPQSRDYIHNISGSRYFIEQNELSSYEDLDYKLKSGQINLAIEIPPNFAKDLLKGKQTQIGVWIDGTQAFRAESIKGYVQGLHFDYLLHLYQENKSSLVDIQARYRYNQDFKSIYSMIPAIIPMLLVFIPAILMAISVAREKELGSIINFYTTPVTKVEFILGKQIPYIIVGLISFSGLLLICLIVFEVIPKGSVLLLFIATLLYLCTTTGIGMIVSTFTKTQIAALASAAVFTILPTVAFSGLTTPVSSLEGVAALMGNIFPASYYMNISRGIFSKNIGLDSLYIDLLALVAISFVIFFINILLLKKEEK
ncbi:MAG: ribosome-associated ATPase/putative transporter RbbA [Arcobacteraceae bacterium]|jgi:ribosome-dependent ATPase|nr:ribosome-associated ATPase/putative transporter RbbA [Arcobacteraceae bacterium]